MEEQKGALNRVRLLGGNSARASNTGAIFKTTSAEPFPLDRQTAIGGETRNAGHSLHNKSTEILRSMWGLCWPASALSKTILSLSCLMTSFPPGAPSESNSVLSPFGFVHGRVCIQPTEPEWEEKKTHWKTFPFSAPLYCLLTDSLQKRSRFLNSAKKMWMVQNFDWLLGGVLFGFSAHC